MRAIARLLMAILISHIAATRPTQAILSTCPSIMITKPILIALFAYTSFVLSAPLGGEELNDCEGKKKDDLCTEILAPGLSVRGVCEVAAVSQSLRRSIVSDRR